MELERYDQDTDIPTIALDQDDRSSLRELLIIYANALQFLPYSEDGRVLLGTIRQLQIKLDTLETMQGNETLDIDILSNRVLQMAFAFYLGVLPLFHLDSEQEQELISEVKRLQAHVSGKRDVQE